MLWQDEEPFPDDENSPPTFGDKVMHYLSLPWKILFAFIPPTDYVSGMPSQPSPLEKQFKAGSVFVSQYSWSASLRP